MNKTTLEALKLAEKMAKRYGVRMCDENGDTHGEELYCVGIDDIADIIREALADHIADTGKVIAEPVKHESVMDYEHICALRESEQIQAGDSYFFVRPENDTPTSRKMFFQGFERGFHKGLKYAAPVSAEAAIEATKEEFIEIVRTIGGKFAQEAEAAIRSMK